MPLHTSYSTLGPDVTGMGNRLQAGRPPPYVPATELSLLSSVGQEMSTDHSCGDALWLRSNGGYDSFHMYSILCDPWLVRAIPECLR